MEKIELKVYGLSAVLTRAGVFVLILSDAGDLRRLPVLIGTDEARSISICLENMKTARPLTHDLFKQLSDVSGMALTEVTIYRFEKGLFYSSLHFQYGKDSWDIDARTSDAVALALRYHCPVYTTEEIMQAAAIPSADDLQFTLPEGLGNEDEDMLMMDLRMDVLESMLAEAVEKEDYERASRIRDIMKIKHKQE